MFSKLFLLLAYFNTTKTVVDNSKALVVYRQPKCLNVAGPSYLELIKYSAKPKKNRTNLRG